MGSPYSVEAGHEGTLASSEPWTSAGTEIFEKVFKTASGGDSDIAAGIA
jgi:hypothetical protein